MVFIIAFRVRSIEKGRDFGLRVEAVGGEARRVGRQPLVRALAPTFEVQKHVPRLGPLAHLNDFRLVPVDEVNSKPQVKHVCAVSLRAVFGVSECHMRLMRIS